MNKDIEDRTFGRVRNHAVDVSTFTVPAVFPKVEDIPYCLTCNELVQFTLTGLDFLHYGEEPWSEVNEDEDNE